MEHIHAQIAVIGGGPAGVCAAIAAARKGMQVVLVTNRPVLGGNSSSEIRVWSRGAVGAGNIYAEEMGIWGELKLESFYRNPEGNPIFWDEVLLDAVLNETNINLYLNTEISDVLLLKEKVTEVCGRQQGSEKEYSITAEVYIDATGDGSIAAKAGIPFHFGDELQVNPTLENMEKKGVLGSSILFYTKKEDHAVTFCAPQYAYGMEKIKDLINKGGRIVSERMSGSDCWWFEYGGQLNTLADNQEIYIELKKLVMGIWNYIKNSGEFAAEEYTLDWIGNIPGKRESRRMITDYILSEQDIVKQKNFADAVAYGGWYIDMHPAGGILEKEKDNCEQQPVLIYQIPLGSLYNSRVKNLLLAGRIIGTERAVFASSRVMNTCALTGQAAGTAAVNMVQKNKGTDEIQFLAKDITLQLHRDDVFLPGSCIFDERDIACEASYQASSSLTEKGPDETDEMELCKGSFIVFPGRGNRRGCFRVRVHDKCVISASLYMSKLPNRHIYGMKLASFEWEVERGTKDIEVQVPNKADSYFCILRFDADSPVVIVCTDTERIGFLCGSKNRLEYQNPCFDYKEDICFYKPDALNNRCNRPWGEPNAWIANTDDTQPWISLRWQKLRLIKEVRIYLDPDLNMEIPSSFTAHFQKAHFLNLRKNMPTHLVKNMDIVLLEGETERKRIEVRDNRKRMVKICIDVSACADQIRIEQIKTWGSNPIIYHIGVFEE